MIDNADLVPAMNKKYGNLYVQDTIPKSTYRGMEADNKQATLMNLLVASEKMSDETAYNIVKTIFESRDDIIAVHKVTAEFKLLKQQTSATPLPFQPSPLQPFTKPVLCLKHSITFPASHPLPCSLFHYTSN